MAEQKLQGKKVAILAADMFEQVELTSRARRSRRPARRPSRLAPGGRDPGLRPLRQGGHGSRSTRPSRRSTPRDYDALLLPGGVGNPDQLRVRRERGRVRARLLRRRASRWRRSATGRGCSSRPASSAAALTSWPSLKTDIRNAGGDWVDEEVVVDDGLVTSRKPDDIPAFNREDDRGVRRGHGTRRRAATRRRTERRRRR